MSYALVSFSWQWKLRPSDEISQITVNYLLCRWLTNRHVMSQQENSAAILWAWDLGSSCKKSHTWLGNAGRNKLIHFHWRLETYLKSAKQPFANSARRTPNHMLKLPHKGVPFIWTAKENANTYVKFWRAASLPQTTLSDPLFRKRQMAAAGWPRAKLSFSLFELTNAWAHSQPPATFLSCACGLPVQEADLTPEQPNVTYERMLWGM